MDDETRRWLDGIAGDDARELIESDAEVIRVVAGPGSGKTTCLKRRTQRLVEGEGINPKKIFVGTFTRAITNELKDALGRDRDITISTLHSHAYKLLRENPAACQGMKLRFLLDFERKTLLYDIKSEISARKVDDCEKQLKKMEARLAQHADFENATFRGAVDRWLREHGAMLIGYVVSLCVSGLESDDIRRATFDHVVIDEYQDLTAAEQKLVDLLWSRNGSLTVLGDNDQSIYGFRYNHPEGILGFHQTWEDRGYDCSKLTFSENWRCDHQILAVANLMRAEAGNPSPMVPRSRQQGKLDLVHWNTSEEEAKGLASYIKSRLKSHSNETFLVLVPYRFIGYQLASEIGDEARTMFTQEVLEHKIAQEAFTAASLLADPNDRVATRVWLGFHGEERKHATGRNAEAYSKLRPAIGGHELLRKIVDQDVVVSCTGKTQVEKRAKKAIGLIEQNLDPGQVVDYLFNPARANDELDDEKRRQLDDSLTKLRAAAHNLLEKQDTPDLRLDELRYRIATRAPLIPDDTEPRVKIMTLHSAKGLEAKNVVIAGIADQLTPGFPPKEDEDPDEKGRLLYVAVTRAKESLIVSWPRNIRYDLMMSNKGRIDGRPITRNGVRWVTTSQSRFTRGWHVRPTRGEDWLTDNVKPDAER